MDDSLAEFNERLRQVINLAASEEGSENTLSAKFTDYMFDALAEAGDGDDARSASYEPRGARASGLHPTEADGTLNRVLPGRAQPCVVAQPGPVTGEHSGLLFCHALAHVVTVSNAVAISDDQ